MTSDLSLEAKAQRWASYLWSGQRDFPPSLKRHVTHCSSVSEEEIDKQRMKFQKGRLTFPDWILPYFCRHVGSGLRADSGQRLCTRLNHQSGRGCHKRNDHGECDQGCICAICGASSHGAFQMRADGEWQCPHRRGMDAEIETFAAQAKCSVEQAWEAIECLIQLKRKNKDDEDGKENDNDAEKFGAAPNISSNSSSGSHDDDDSANNVAPAAGPWLQTAKAKQPFATAPPPPPPTVDKSAWPKLGGEGKKKKKKDEEINGRDRDNENPMIEAAEEGQRHSPSQKPVATPMPVASYIPPSVTSPNYSHSGLYPSQSSASSMTSHAPAPSTAAAYAYASSAASSSLVHHSPGDIEGVTFEPPTLTVEEGQSQAAAAAAATSQPLPLYHAGTYTPGEGEQNQNQNPHQHVHTSTSYMYAAPSAQHYQQLQQQQQQQQQAQGHEYKSSEAVAQGQTQPPMYGSVGQGQVHGHSSNVASSASTSTSAVAMISASTLAAASSSSSAGVGVGVGSPVRLDVYLPGMDTAIRVRAESVKILREEVRYRGITLPSTIAFTLNQPSTPNSCPSPSSLLTDQHFATLLSDGSKVWLVEYACIPVEIMRFTNPDLSNDEKCRRCGMRVDDECHTNSTATFQPIELPNTNNNSSSSSVVSASALGSQPLLSPSSSAQATTVPTPVYSSHIHQQQPGHHATLPAMMPPYQTSALSLAPNVSAAAPPPYTHVSVTASAAPAAAASSTPASASMQQQMYHAHQYQQHHHQHQQYYPVSAAVAPAPAPAPTAGVYVQQSGNPLHFHAALPQPQPGQQQIAQQHQQQHSIYYQASTAPRHVH